ncbi:glycosyltransferase family 2 protein [Conexibacter sp. DBS9H8]|uniref:glycosyltransferase family 2 protein n=1 Tax=Conexibacter sp. DBS9H8 TaxID=2937801 RepID=UPI00200E3114|nr:glycosyltransferase family 2 protein [Conexibacter sp. DBS9H8]
MPVSSIIIVTYGQRARTEACLASLERCLGTRLGDDWELVIVDNASPDDTRQLLVGWTDRATVSLLEENVHFAAGCNHGARLASGDVLVFLNNDTEVAPGALETLAEQAREPGVAAAGCRLLYPDGTLQHAGVAFLASPAHGGAAMAEHVLHHREGELAASTGRWEADCVTAACVAVSTSAFASVGGFDEGYVDGLEDVDLCLKLRSVGGRIVYRGDVSIIHHEGASRGQGAAQWLTPERAARMAGNDRRFISRWGTLLGPDDDLAAAVWDARLERHPPARDPAAVGDVLVLGAPAGIGPLGDETRALLLSLEATGWTPAAVDLPASLLVARGTGAAAQAAERARRASLPTGVPVIRVGTAGPALDLPGSPLTVRLLGGRLGPDLAGATAVWCPSPAMLATAAAAGIAPARLELVPPTVAPHPPGGGGAGILALLPTHLPAQADATLATLSRLPGGIELRILPAATVRGLDAELAARLPGAELLGPCADETRFATLAAEADVVLSLDPWDVCERRLLVAAGVGAAVVGAGPGGPAAHVLGLDPHSVSLETPAELRRALASADRSAPARADRARRVVAACAPEAIAQVLAGWRGGPRRAQAGLATGAGSVR